MFLVNRQVIARFHWSDISVGFCIFGVFGESANNHGILIGLIFLSVFAFLVFSVNLQTITGFDCSDISVFFFCFETVTGFNWSDISVVFFLCLFVFLLVTSACRQGGGSCSVRGVRCQGYRREACA